MQSDTPTPEPITSTRQRNVRARAFLTHMVEQGLLEAEDGDTYRITEKGKAQAALHREGRV